MMSSSFTGFDIYPVLAYTKLQEVIKILVSIPPRLQLSLSNPCQRKVDKLKANAKPPFIAYVYRQLLTKVTLGLCISAGLSTCFIIPDLPLIS